MNNFTLIFLVLNIELNKQFYCKTTYEICCEITKRFMSFPDRGGNCKSLIITINKTSLLYRLSHKGFETLLISLLYVSTVNYISKLHTTLKSMGLMIV